MQPSTIPVFRLGVRSHRCSWETMILEKVRLVWQHGHVGTIPVETFLGHAFLLQGSALGRRFDLLGAPRCYGAAGECKYPYAGLGRQRSMAEQARLLLGCGSQSL